MSSTAFSNWISRRVALDSRKAAQAKAGIPVGAAMAYGDGRTGRTLFAATKPFAQESRARSWWVLLSTLVVVGGGLTAAVLTPWWPVSALLSVLSGLAMVRLFIVFHDYIHGAILRRSGLAKTILYACGGLMFAPPSSWRRNHNLHHTHSGNLGREQGGFPLMTVAEWQQATGKERFIYRFSRHPLILLAAAFTIFFLSMTVIPLVQDWRKHWDSIPSILGHAGIIVLLWLLGGFFTAFFGFILPFAVAAALGAYLFFVQHNYAGMKLLPAADWSTEESSLVGSSHLELGPVMRWFTGNIGYHNVHHLNRAIPFYRLPETMKAIPELQGSYAKTTLSPRDVVANFRVALWDEDRDRMVSYREAGSPAAA